MTTPGLLLVCDGNSLTWMSNSYPSQIEPLLESMGVHTRVVNRGIGGDTTEGMILDAPRDVDPFYSSMYEDNIVVVWEGPNDIYYNDDGAAAYQRLVTCCRARKAAGFKVVILTVLPCSSPSYPADFNTQRAVCNSLIRANWPTFADALADVAADNRIGDDGDSDNATYYVDRLHMTTAGYAIVTGIVLDALREILSVPGWEDARDPWVYDSPNSFRMAGVDVRNRYPVGASLSFMNGGATKYANVVGAVYSGGNTTIGIFGNTLSNGPITRPRLSYAENPSGFPPAFDFTPPSSVGWASPAFSCWLRFRGRLATVGYAITGQSDDYSASIALPITAAKAASAKPVNVRNNGAYTASADAFVNAGGATLYFQLGGSSVGWTPSGTKTLWGQIEIPI